MADAETRVSDEGDSGDAALKVVAQGLSQLLGVTRKEWQDALQQLELRMKEDMRLQVASAKEMVHALLQQQMEDAEAERIQRLQKQEVITKLEETIRNLETKIVENDGMSRTISSRMEERMERLEERVKDLEMRLPLSEEQQTLDGTEKQDAMDILEERVTALEMCTQQKPESTLSRVDVVVPQLDGQCPVQSVPDQMPDSIASTSHVSTASSSSSEPPSASVSTPSMSSEPKLSATNILLQPPADYATPQIFRERTSSPIPSTASAISDSSSSFGSSLAPISHPAMVSAPQISTSSSTPDDPAQQGTLGEQLIKASKEGDLESVCAALDAGADVNYIGPFEETALMEACSRGNVSVASLLLQRGANIQATKSFSGWTALHFAAAHDRSGQCVVELLGAGALVDCRDSWGKTPMQMAAVNGNEAAVQALLAAGASTTLRDNNGNSTLELASSNAVRRLLRP